MKALRILVVSPIFTLAAIAQPVPPLPPVPVPPENPITEPKRVLGKTLFWDEQLSADNTMACATCHLPARGGTDPRRVRAPGPDNVLNTPDDIFASPGVIRTDTLEDYLRDPVFGVTPQVTPRTANSMINAAYNPLLFWDGRATGQFTDPVTGALVIPAGAALESQSVGPPASSVEMGHDGLNWVAITAKLQTVQPLALGVNIPPDVSAVLAGKPSYAALFQSAFGDSAITAPRVAMALATYERTLIANDSPWDRFNAGDPNAMTQGQIAGWNFFRANDCNLCHTAPLFSSNTFRNIGVRPPAEDTGRQAITGNPIDAGRFKVPSLRNVGLKSSFMHNGQFTNLGQVFGFYSRAPGSPPMFPQNLDPLMPTPVPPNVAPALQDFLANALTDVRVRDELFPFDRPTLWSQRPADQPVALGGGTTGSGAIVPQIITASPPMIGSEDFRIGLDRALGGATARLGVSATPPVGGVIVPTLFYPATTASGAGSGVGVATLHWPLTGPNVRPGQTIFAQWIIDDPAAPGGQSRSTVASYRFFCGSMGCPTICAADFNGDNGISVQDVFEFLASYFSNEPRADVNASVTLSVEDVFTFLNDYFTGCPG